MFQSGTLTKVRPVQMDTLRMRRMVFRRRLLNRILSKSISIHENNDQTNFFDTDGLKMD